jgi:hypothetical protein
MFTFAMITGARQSWLKHKAYAESARKGWLAVKQVHRPERQWRQGLRRHRSDQQPAVLFDAPHRKGRLRTARRPSSGAWPPC